MLHGTEWNCWHAWELNLVNRKWFINLFFFYLKNLFSYTNMMNFSCFHSINLCHFPPTSSRSSLIFSIHLSSSCLNVGFLTLTFPCRTAFVVFHFSSFFLAFFFDSLTIQEFIIYFTLFVDFPFCLMLLISSYIYYCGQKRYLLWS